jgi:phosphatidylglycerophosphate synthase
MKYTYRMVKDSYSNNKYKNDLISHIWYLLLRPISFVFAAMFASLNIKPINITYLSIIVVFISTIIISFGYWSEYFLYLGSALLIIYGLLDCIDGDMARVMNLKSKIGGYYDSIGGILFHSLTPIAFSIYIYSTNENIHILNFQFSNTTIFFIVGVEVYSIFFRTVIRQAAIIKFNYDSGAKAKKDEKINLFRMLPRIPSNARAPLLIISIMLNMVPLCMFFYMIYNIFILVAVLVKIYLFTLTCSKV